MKTLINSTLLAFTMAVSLDAAPVVKPQYVLEASAFVTDIVLEGNHLYAATDKAVVDVFDIQSKKRTGKITLPEVKDFVGDMIAPKIHDIDRMGGKLLMVSEGVAGFRDVYIHDGKTLLKIIDASEKLFIKRAAFVDEKTVLFGLLSSEIVLYDIMNKKLLYRHPVSSESSGGSVFGDMALNEAKTKVAVADESGEVHLFGIKEFSLLGVYKGQNLDNIYKIDYKKGVIITAGRDRRCAVYTESGAAYYMKSPFLVYSAALSPSGRTGVYAAGIENDLQLFNTLSQSKIARLKGHNATPTGFAFLNEKELFSSAEEKNILFWSLK